MGDRKPCGLCSPSRTPTSHWLIRDHQLFPGPRRLVSVPPWLPVPPPLESIPKEKPVATEAPTQPPPRLQGPSPSPSAWRLPPESLCRVAPIPPALCPQGTFPRAPTALPARWHPPQPRRHWAEPSQPPGCRDRGAYLLGLLSPWSPYSMAAPRKPEDADGVRTQWTRVMVKVPWETPRQETYRAGAMLPPGQKPSVGGYAGHAPCPYSTALATPRGWAGQPRSRTAQLYVPAAHTEAVSPSPSPLPPPRDSGAEPGPDVGELQDPRLPG